jgi:hypothetical protein
MLVVDLRERGQGARCSLSDVCEQCDVELDQGSGSQKRKFVYVIR